MNGQLNGFFKNIIEFNREYIKGTFIEANLDRINNETVSKEEIVTKRFGKEIKRVVNKELNECRVQKIQNLINKDNAGVIIRSMLKNKQTDDFADPTSSQ